MFNFVKKIKFKILKRQIISCASAYGKSETLKNISEIINFSEFHQHDFKKNLGDSSINEFITKGNDKINIITKSKKVLITQSKNQDNNINKNVNF